MYMHLLTAASTSIFHHYWHTLVTSAHPSLVQSRTLRLLANAYLEWDSTANWQKALNAVGA